MMNIHYVMGRKGFKTLAAHVNYICSQLVTGKAGREHLGFPIKTVFCWFFRLCTRLVLGSVQIQQLHSICSQKFVLWERGLKSSDFPTCLCKLGLNQIYHLTSG